MRTRNSDNSQQINEGASQAECSAMLDRWLQGDLDAQKTIISLIYDELRSLAQRYMRGESGLHTLQPTALIHEAYIRLCQENRPVFKNRAHLMGFLARLMRQVLVNHAKSRQAAKRGLGQRNITLEPGLALFEEPHVELVALDDALNQLAVFDGRQAQIVELRFFGGLTIEETAAAMSLSPRSIVKEWSMARAWLRRELES